MSALLQFPIARRVESEFASGFAGVVLAKTGTVDIMASAAVLPPSLLATAVHHIQRRLPVVVAEPLEGVEVHLGPELVVAESELDDGENDGEDDEGIAGDAISTDEVISSWAFYRKHTENLLRRYLYASMQVGRSPDILGECVGRGWVSSRKVRTFEDALIFVLDVERCLGRLEKIEQQMITRRVLQEYSYPETARLLRVSLSTVYQKFPLALDRLTEELVGSDLLSVPA
jgi:hypothetical protein